MNLYHYTDQNGFMGIFRNQELWASKIQYLNDSSEYNLAIGMAREHLGELIKENTVQSAWVNLRVLLEYTSKIKNVNICVCSLTEKGDLLSQWRGYSRSLGGYSIGFKQSSLDRIIKDQGFNLVQCIYDAKKQKREICQMIDEVIDEVNDNNSGIKFNSDRKYLNAVDLFTERLSSIAPKFKDGSFSEEAEWRIIGKVSFDELQFRSGQSMLTPYCKVNLNDGNARHFNSLINEVIVGHTPNPDLAVSATEAFIINNIPPLNNGDYTCEIKVRKSEIPFRNW